MGGANRGDSCGSHQVLKEGVPFGRLRNVLDGKIREHKETYIGKECCKAQDNKMLYECV